MLDICNLINVRIYEISEIFNFRIYLLKTRSFFSEGKETFLQLNTRIESKTFES